jgi:hypothetical protein
MFTQELITKLKNEWTQPKNVVHRGEEIPFKLRCTFEESISEIQITNILKEIEVPPELTDFWLTCNSSRLFEDSQYGQWGLSIFSAEKAIQKTGEYKSERTQDARNGDLIIGSFIGDSDMLLVRCDSENTDYGNITIVNAIDSRNDWDLVAENFNEFFNKYADYYGDKYWELNT